MHMPTPGGLNQRQGDWAFTSHGSRTRLRARQGAAGIGWQCGSTDPVGESVFSITPINGGRLQTVSFSAGCLGDEFDLPLGRVVHGFAAKKQRKVQLLLVNTEYVPFTNCRRVSRTAPLFSRLIPWPF